MHKILYLSYDGLTDPLGQSQILPYLKGLCQYGFEFTVISAEKKHNYVANNKDIEASLKGYSIDWEPVFYTSKPPVLSTLYDIEVFKRKSKALHKKKKFDLVHCRSYISALIGLFLKKKYNLPFIFDMRGFWADERVDGGLWNLNNLIYRRVYRYFKKKEWQFLKEADCTISLTHNAKNEILSWKDLSDLPIKVIPCCVDYQFFDYSLFPEKIKNKESIDLIYLGSLGTWYMLDEMLDFFKILHALKPRSVFHFVTKDDPSLIIQRAKEKGIPSECLSIRSAERENVPKELSKSDIAVFFILPKYSKKASSATKMGELLAMGIPVITNAQVGDHHFLFEKYQPGYLLDQFCDSAYRAAADNIDSLLHKDRKSLRTIALDYFALEKGVEGYKNVYQKILPS